MKDAPPITPPPSLPDDPAALKALIATLMRQRDEDAAARGTLLCRVEALEMKSLVSDT